MVLGKKVLASLEVFIITDDTLNKGLDARILPATRNRKKICEVSQQS